MDTSLDVAGHLAKLEDDFESAQANLGRIKKGISQAQGAPATFADDMTLHLRVDDNPFPRMSSKCHRVFDIIECGMTVGAFRKRVIASGLGEDGWGHLQVSSSGEASLRSGSLVAEV